MRVRWGRGPSIDGRLLESLPVARRYHRMAVVAGFLAATTTIAAAWLLSLLIAAVFVDSRPPDAVVPLLAALVLLAGARAGLLLASEVFAQRGASRLKQELRHELTGRLFELGPARVSAERSGELASTLVNGLEALDAWMTSYLPARTLGVAVPLLVLAVVLVIDPPTALVLVFTGPVLVLLLAMIGSRTQAISERRFAELRWMSAYFVDMLRGIATLKAFGRSTEQVATMRAISRQYGETTLEVLRSAFQTGLVLDWAGAVAMALVAVEVSLRLMVGDLPFERALAVLVIAPEFFLALRTLAHRYHAGMAGRAAAGRVFAILDAPVPAASPTAAAPRARPPAAGPGIPAGPPAIAFDRVSYRYPERDVRAIDGVTFAIPAGGRLTIVGPSGAGKSTLAGLLLRFLEPDDGRITVGGLDLAALDRDAWRSTIGYVPQSPRLFHGTIADNLRLARPDATTQELHAAVGLAGGAEMIADVPNGLDTQVGEGGVRLSGGQRQRLAIARALLRDPGLLLLDEPTAHLDTSGEEAIVALLERLGGARTIIAISHRPRLALTSDVVAVLDEGRLVEIGPPQALQRAGGAFAGLVAAWPADNDTVGANGHDRVWVPARASGESPA